MGIIVLAEILKDKNGPAMQSDLANRGGGLIIAERPCLVQLLQTYKEYPFVLQGG